MELSELLEQLKKDLSNVNSFDLFEHKIYKRISKTNSSYRQDSGNTNTKTMQHSHVYAKQKGSGGQIYAVNNDGTAHDGYKGVEIPSEHADFFRGKGYKINLKNILESIQISAFDRIEYMLYIIEE